MRFPSLPAIVAAITCVLGCSDAVAPGESHPMAGTYDVTATMDSAAFRQSCASPAVGYCYPREPANGMVALSGQLVVGNSFAYAADGWRHVSLDAVMTTQGCGSDGRGNGCASRGMAETKTYAGTASEVTLALLPMPLVVQPTPDAVGGIAFSATFAGDSLTGAVGFTGENLTRYSGHFVARRRPH